MAPIALRMQSVDSRYQAQGAHQRGVLSSERPTSRRALRRLWCQLQRAGQTRLSVQPSSRRAQSADIDGRDIIIVEDIIDSGFTINFLVNRLRNSGPKSVAVASILFKKEVAKLDFEVDYIGFEIPPEFVVGYGLDYDEKYRHLKDVMVLEPKDLD